MKNGDSSSDDESDDDAPDLTEGGYDNEDETLGMLTNPTKAAEIDAILSKIKLPIFDPIKQLKPDALCLVAGKRRFGKSVWTRWCFSKIGHWFPDGVYVFTTTKHNWFWQQHVPDSRIYYGFDWEVIGKLLDVQLEKWERRKRTGEESLDYIALIFDDCISERNDARYAVELLRLVFNGRHFMISIWLLAQDIKGFFPDVRANTDYCMMTYQIQKRQTDVLRDDFASFFSNKDVFGEMLRRNTQDHQLLVIDQSTAKYHPNDGVFSIGKGELDVEPFQLGDYDFWDDSGCIWEEQVKKWDNIVKSALEPEDIERIAKQRIKESKLKARIRKEEEEQYRTAAWWAATGEAAEAHDRKVLQEAKGGHPDTAELVQHLMQDLNRAYIETEHGYVPYRQTPAERGKDKRTISAREIPGYSSLKWHERDPEREWNAARNAFAKGAKPPTLHQRLDFRTAQFPRGSSLPKLSPEQALGKHIKFD